MELSTGHLDFLPHLERNPQRIGNLEQRYPELETYLELAQFLEVASSLWQACNQNSVT